MRRKRSFRRFSDEAFEKAREELFKKIGVPVDIENGYDFATALTEAGLVNEDESYMSYLHSDAGIYYTNQDYDKAAVEREFLDTVKMELETIDSDSFLEKLSKAGYNTEGAVYWHEIEGIEITSRYSSYEAGSLSLLELSAAEYEIVEGSLKGTEFSAFDCVGKGLPVIDEFIVDGSIYEIFDMYNCTISATATFVDGSYITFDADQNADVYYFHVYEAGGDDLSIAKLILPTVEELKVWEEMDDFVSWLCEY